jgi:integration host factor subunit beta
VIKSNLVNALNEKLPELQKKDVELALNCILGQLENALVQGERIEIRGFGSFDCRHRPPHIGRNPKTGEAVNLPAKVAIHFKPGKDMRDLVDAARDQCGILKRGFNWLQMLDG